ncbi:variant erythrocyte surface antigen-1 family protein [Babesia caballi]|uniref:Variant erythrocyte surface antigen-1 family protein n=1 Tax=Babesia caballi TaxID=5871 RepID=A0AAV4M0E4_BABCB|nr:variant erythrocyte surface antigen-1 family protein [Babesia caballi]
MSGKSLTDCPSNLKEAIDWILRVTGKDGGSSGDNGTQQLAKAVSALLEGVKPFVPELEKKFDNIKEALKPDAADGIINALGDGLKEFRDGIKSMNYSSAYNGQSNWSSAFRGTSGVPATDQSPPEVAAKIFLGCVPMIFSALSYLYWRCHDKGGWKDLKLNDKNGSALKHFMASQGFDGKQLKSDSNGGQKVAEALQGFNSFHSTINGNSSFTHFLKNLRNATPTTTHPLSALFLGATFYFESKRHKTHKSPSNIHQMLYWLSGLAVTPQFIDLLDNFSSVIGTDFQVAISGSHEQNEKLSADDMAGHLIASCISSPWVLGTIKGPGDSNNPLLHDLFCNKMGFTYPSGPALFSNVSNYAYALQFQLHFLYQQCSNTYTGGRGWRDCRFGKDINKDTKGQSVTSHICQGYNCGGKSDCKHDGQNDSTSCKHNKKDGPTCGQGPNSSPLQAFLTDSLPGFSRGQPSDPSSHLATCSGYMCHVPMGFTAENLHAAANANTQGENICLTLRPFCGGFNTPLRQLSEKLGCLTKRTPRTLGDLFGFTWHLKGQLAKSFDNIENAEWLKNLVGHTPFSNNLIKDHGNKLNELVGTTHTNTHHDLTSLSNSGCNKNNTSCGPYLAPLTLSNGATFGKPPSYASTYLSWMVYLIDDLEMGFQELLDEFRSIDCSKTGCRKPASGSQHGCQTPHAPGTHGTSNNCSCDSVVHCGGVLPLLYRYGFTFGSTGDLYGEGNNGTNTKRTCANFHDQLQSVISGNPLSNLLTSIDDFLFLFRYYFLSNLSGFWTIYICLILYTFFFLLDTLHLRSHLKLTSSHVVPPLDLLTSGKPLPITKLTYITQ